MAMLLLVVVVVDINLGLSTKNEACPAIPTRFNSEKPYCAERLPRAANLSNVRIIVANMMPLNR